MSVQATPFKIESGVKLLERRRDRVRATVTQLGIGDSFIVPTKSDYTEVYIQARLASMKVTSRLLKDGSGYRFWRVK